MLLACCCYAVGGLLLCSCYCWVCYAAVMLLSGCCFGVVLPALCRLLSLCCCRCVQYYSFIGFILLLVLVCFIVLCPFVSNFSIAARHSSWLYSVSCWTSLSSCVWRTQKIDSIIYCVYICSCICHRLFVLSVAWWFSIFSVVCLVFSWFFEIDVSRIWTFSKCIGENYNQLEQWLVDLL